MSTTEQDSTRVAISGVRRGGVIPSNRSEMWRDVFLSSGADVRGSIWGNRLIVEGPGIRVDGSVYVRGEITVTSDSASPGNRRGVTFGSTTTCGGSLVVEGRDSRTRFLSSAYAGIARLSNAIVYGNLYARSAVIRDSVIVGGVFCQESVVLENCIVATFRARAAKLGNDVLMLFPVAVADERIEMSAPVHAVSFLKLARQAGAHTHEGGVIRLTEDDVYVLPFSDNEQGTAQVLSLGHRVGDTYEVMRAFRENRRIIEYLELADHLPDGERKKVRGPALTQFETQLLGLLSAQDISEVTGSSSIIDLVARADVLAGISRMAGPDVAGAIRASAPVLAAPTESGETRGDGAPLPPDLAALFRYAPDADPSP